MVAVTSEYARIRGYNRDLGNMRDAYSEESTLREARARYFERNGFGSDGGYTSRWVKIQLGRLPVRFPNTAPRVRAVRYHDLHHVLTGYQTTNTGEAEIGGWEIGSGCRGFWAAWALNLMAMSMGLVLAPRAVAVAFFRGRDSENLYGQPFDDALLDSSVGDVRTRLRLDSPDVDPSPADRVLLVFAYAAGVGLSLVHLAVPIALVSWLIAGMLGW